MESLVIPQKLTGIRNSYNEVRDCKSTEVSRANQLIKILADREFLSSQIGLVVGINHKIRASEMLHMCHHRENVKLQNCS